MNKKFANVMKLFFITTMVVSLCCFAACGGNEEETPETPTTYTVTVAVNNAEYGSVSETSIADVAKDTVITVDGNKLTIGSTEITATPAAETAGCTYAFVDWAYDGNTVTGNITVTANFSATVKQYTVTFDMDGGTLSKGEQSNITSLTLDYNTPASDLDDYDKTKEGYEFVKWQVLTDNDYLDLPADAKIEGNVTLKAVWVQLFTVTVENGTGSGSYTDGTEITVTANEYTTKEFVKWTSSGADVSTENPYTFNVTEDITLTAEFVNVPVTITTGTVFDSGWDIEPVENWVNSGKAISFEYKNDTGDAFEYFYFAGYAGDTRVTRQVGIVVSDSSTYGSANTIYGNASGTITALGDGWYRFFANFSDIAIYTNNGSDGTETITKIEFGNIGGNSLSLNNISTVEEKQFAPKQLTAGCVLSDGWNLKPVENWKTSNKALYFEYKNVSGAAFYITPQSSSATIGRQISVNADNTVSFWDDAGAQMKYGNVTDLGNGWYGVLINYQDLGVAGNVASNGEATLSQFYFTGVGSNIIYVNNINTLADCVQD